MINKKIKKTTQFFEKIEKELTELLNNPDNSEKHLTMWVNRGVGTTTWINSMLKKISSSYVVVPVLNDKSKFERGKAISVKELNRFLLGKCDVVLLYEGNLTDYVRINRYQLLGCGYIKFLVSFLKD